MSHPMWVRGLKHEQQINLPIDEEVAPHVGAWIETKTHEALRKSIKSRTPCGCVD